MTQSFFVRGPLPGTNDFAGTKTRWHYADLKKNWQASILYDIRTAKLKPMKSALVKFHWNEKSKRRDPDNLIASQKFIFDALVNAGILPDDGQDEVLGIVHVWRVDASNPGVLVTLEGQ